jgi:hypothetical protein
MATQLDFKSEERAMCFNEVSGHYEDPQRAEKIWMAYSKDCCRYGLEDKAEEILHIARNSLELDILLAGIVQDAEKENTGKKYLEQSEDSDAYDPNATLLTSNMFAQEYEQGRFNEKPVVLYDQKKRTRIDSRSWNKSSAKYHAKKSKNKN